jgi:TPR repeat protein
VVLGGICSALLVSAPVAAESDSTVSHKLVQQVEAWQQSAREGDADALFNLGQYFRKGIGIEPDLEQARHFYQQAAELGHAGAQLNLGTLYYFVSAEPDLEKVRYWWQQAAEQGEPSAQYQLAILLLKLPEPQPEVSLMWMNRAHAQGYPPASKALTHLKAAYPQLVESRITEMPVVAKPESEPELKQAPAVVAEVIVEPEVKGQPDVESVQEAAQVANEIKPDDISVAINSEADVSPNDGAVADKVVVTETAVVEQLVAAEPDEAVAEGWQAAVYTVQLASLTDNASAQGLLKTLQGRHSSVLEPQPLRVQPASVSGKQVYRVQAGAFADRAGADRLCARLKQAGQGCFPSRLR